MRRKLLNNSLWIIFGIFCTIAITTSDEPVLTSSGPYSFGKYIAWLAFFAFLLYTVLISHRESFFKSLRRMWPILWSRQIGLDLYIGIGMFLILIFVNEGSFLLGLLWLIPVLIFANLATLLYVALNYESLVSLITS